MTVREAADRLGRTPQAVRVMCQQGRLAARYRIVNGRAEWDIEPASLAAFLRSHDARDSASGQRWIKRRQAAE